MEKVTRKNIAEHLVEYELRLVGKTMNDVMDDKQWYINNTLTREQADAFKKYSIALIKKTFKCNKSKAESTFNWFWLQFGLKISNNNGES